MGSARVSRAGERVLAIANFSPRHATIENMGLNKLVSAARRNPVAAATATLSPVRGTNATQPKFGRHLLRVRHEKCRFASD
jgi:hypothetical protein